MTGPAGARRQARPQQPAVDPAEWTPSELASAADWIFDLSDTDIGELDAAIAEARAAGRRIMDIRTDNFPLPGVETKLAALRHQIMDGRGVGLLRGLPVARLGLEATAMAFWGIGVRLGEPVSQNAMGHLLGHVVNLVDKDIETPSHRGYQTRMEMNYHCDSCDVAALLCVRPAKSGGITRVTSSIAVHNEMMRRRPDLAAALAGPLYRDRREEVPPGKDPWFVLPAFNYVDDHLVVNWQGQYVRSAQRFPDVPRFTAAQREAIDLLTELAMELSQGVLLAPGDMLVLHNHVVMHSRTEFEDFSEPERRRHLMRLWLATPGGRPIPEAMLERYVGLKPGQRPSGIVVEDTRLCTPLGT